MARRPSISLLTLYYLTLQDLRGASLKAPENRPRWKGSGAKGAGDIITRKLVSKHLRVGLAGAVHLDELQYNTLP